MVIFWGSDNTFALQLKTVSALYGQKTLALAITVVMDRVIFVHDDINEVDHLQYNILLVIFLTRPILKHFCCENSL